MSVSCVGTCSNCGGKRFWLSDTLSLQLDDGRLKCLPHPAESGTCEREGLTLAQASERGRLYRETFYVCRNCGKDGETIEKWIIKDSAPLTAFSVRGAVKWGWGSAAIVVPFLIWMEWWEVAAVIGSTLMVLPVIAWRENRKIERELAARGLPRADAPGRMPVTAPTAGSRPDMDTVVGRALPAEAGELRATGPCCDKPDWVDASSVKDEDRVPCSTCGQGIMVVSKHSIH